VTGSHDKTSLPKLADKIRPIAQGALAKQKQAIPGEKVIFLEDSRLEIHQRIALIVRYQPLVKEIQI
jgi:hypothetical protein